MDYEDLEKMSEKEREELCDKYDCYDDELANLLCDDIILQNKLEDEAVQKAYDLFENFIIPNAKTEEDIFASMITIKNIPNLKCVRFAYSINGIRKFIEVSNKKDID